MKRTTLAGHPCSVARTLDVAGEWWTLLIVRDVAYGVSRFRAIQADLGISANVLAERLDSLVADRVLERVVYQQRPLRHEYALTEKGAELVPILLALAAWGDRWAWGSGSGPVRVEHSECGHEVSVEVRCPECERAAAPRELRARLRDPAALPPAADGPGSVSARHLRAGGEGVPLQV